MGTSNKLVSMVIYPVVYEYNTNMEISVDSNNDKIIEKQKEQVSPFEQYMFVTEKDLLNIGYGKIESIN